MAKPEGIELLFYFLSPGSDNQCAQRTRNREINHCALTGAKKKSLVHKKYGFAKTLNQLLSLCS